MNSNIMISTRHFFLRPVLIFKPHSLGESLVKVGCWSGLWVFFLGVRMVRGLEYYERRGNGALHVGGVLWAFMVVDLWF